MLILSNISHCLEVSSDMEEEGTFESHGNLNFMFTRDKLIVQSSDGESKTFQKTPEGIIIKTQTGERGASILADEKTRLIVSAIDYGENEILQYDFKWFEQNVTEYAGNNSTMLRGFYALRIQCPDDMQEDEVISFELCPDVWYFSSEVAQGLGVSVFFLSLYVLYNWLNAGYCCCSESRAKKFEDLNFIMKFFYVLQRIASFFLHNADLFSDFTYLTTVQVFNAAIWWLMLISIFIPFAISSGVAFACRPGSNNTTGTSAENELFGGFGGFFKSYFGFQYLK